MSRRLAIGQTKRDTWPAGKVALHVQPGTVLQTYNSLLVRLLPPLSHLSFYFHPCPIIRCLKKEVSKSHHFCVGSQPMMPLHLDLIKTFVQRTKLSNHITKSVTSIDKLMHLGAFKAFYQWSVTANRYIFYMQQTFYLVL